VYVHFAQGLKLYSPPPSLLIAVPPLDILLISSPLESLLLPKPYVSVRIALPPLYHLFFPFDLILREFTHQFFLCPPPSFKEPLHGNGSSFLSQLLCVTDASLAQHPPHPVSGGFRFRHFAPPRAYFHACVSPRCPLLAWQTGTPPLPPRLLFGNRLSPGSSDPSIGVHAGFAPLFFTCGLGIPPPHL